MNTEPRLPHERHYGVTVQRSDGSLEHDWRVSAIGDQGDDRILVKKETDEGVLYKRVTFEALTENNDPSIVKSILGAIALRGEIDQVENNISSLDDHRFSRFAPPETSDTLKNDEVSAPKPELIENVPSHLAPRHIGRLTAVPSPTTQAPEALSTWTTGVKTGAVQIIPPSQLKR